MKTIKQRKVMPKPPSDPERVAYPGYAPCRGEGVRGRPWEGPFARKPWEYRVTAVIPCLDTPDELELVVELLRLQTERPYVVVIDTGSTPENLARVEALRADDLEVLALRMNGVKHPSDFPAIAMDLAFARCQTQWMFATHADCFLKRRDVIEEFITLAALHRSPVVGYQISPRNHKGWEGMVSHTATLLCMETMLEIGAGWNQRRVALAHGYADHRPDPEVFEPNWPDTEICLNWVLRRHGITPHLVDEAAPVEQNFERNEDHRIDHCRTLTAGKLYAPGHYQKAKAWAEDARAAAAERIAEWKARQDFSH